MRVWIRRFLGFGTTFSVLALFFYAAGRLDWGLGWAYLGLLFGGMLFGYPYLQKKDPELMAHRGKIGEGTFGWDKIVLTCFALTFLGILITGALDERYGWSFMPAWLWLPGCALYLGFYLLILRCMTVNTHFEKTVRIQQDRNHKVIDTGPYRYVRHPGYLCLLFGYILNAPLLLGSWWAFVPAFLCALSILVRTALEDGTLRRELDGYEAYARRVPYRLVRGLW